MPVHCGPKTDVTKICRAIPKTAIFKSLARNLHYTWSRPPCTTSLLCHGPFTRLQETTLSSILQACTIWGSSAPRHMKPARYSTLLLLLSLAYFPSPRHGASSRCGWRRRSPGMEGSWEYVEQPTMGSSLRAACRSDNRKNIDLLRDFTRASGFNWYFEIGAWVSELNLAGSR